MKLIISSLLLLIKAMCIFTQWDYTTWGPTTTPWWYTQTTNQYPPTTPWWYTLYTTNRPTQQSTTGQPRSSTDISIYELRYELERKVAQIKSGVSTHVAEVVRIENLSLNVLAEMSSLEKFRSVVAEYDRHYAFDFELKIFLDEVKSEVDWAINAYADMGLKINRTFCHK